MDGLQQLVTKIKALLGKGSDGYQHWVTSVTEDELFCDVYEKGLIATGTKPSVWRRDRFYNLYELFKATRSLPGGFAECGCWKGLSALLVCGTEKYLNPSFLGEGFHIYDSFQGPSQPNAKESVSLSGTGVQAGTFAASLEEVKGRLRDYPRVTYHPGFIPQTLEPESEDVYRFVHVDLDLVEPTLASFEYFFDRLVPGGILLCDDYGSYLWKETKKALDAFAVRRNVPLFRLSTGQCYVLKDFGNVPAPRLSV